MPVWVDAAPLLREERERCFKIRRQIQRAREQLERFTRQTRSRFEQWVASTFGSELTRLRETESRVMELQGLVEEVYEEADRNFCSEAEAYVSVLRRRASRDGAAEAREVPDEDLFEHARRQEQERESRERDHEDSAPLNELRKEFVRMYGTRPGDPGLAADYDVLWKAFRSAMGLGEEAGSEEASRPGRKQSRSEGQRDEEEASPDPSSSASAGRVSTDARLKQLYRALARKLHPDSNRELSADQRDLWHQVQAAYDRADLEQLEALSVFGGLLEESLETVDRVSTLQRIFEGLATQKRALDRELRGARKDQAWGFDQVREDPRRLRMMTDRIRFELDDEIERYASHLARIEAEIERWKRAGRRVERAPQGGRGSAGGGRGRGRGKSRRR